MTTHPERIPQKRSAKNHTTPSGRAYNLLSSAKKRAIKKNLEFNVSVEKIIKAIKNGHCELTGLKFDMNRASKTQINPYSPSIDRKDSNKGYTNENVRIVLSAVNSALNQFGDDIMLPILKAMIKSIEKNAKPNSTPPVPKRTNLKGIDNSQSGTSVTPGTRQDYNHTDNHSGAVQGQDADHSTQESGRDSLGRRSKEVGTLEAPKSIKDNGKPPNPNIWP